MSENLLSNWGFEHGLAQPDDIHRVLVIPPELENSPHYETIHNIENARDWTFWFRHQPRVWDQPEAGLTPEALRIQTGGWAYHLRLLWRKMDAGLFQRVFIERAMRLEFRAGAHAWSNAEGREHSDDPLWSEGPGFGPGYCLAVDAPDDDWRNFGFLGGVDTTGGTDPRAGSVLWGATANIYNEYHQIPAVVLDVERGWLTVFIAVQTMWPFKHNDAYLDCAYLGEVEEPAPPRGLPRVQYERTYVLLPQGADCDWVFAVISASWKARRWTLGGSADDAGIGDLDVRRIIAINPQGWPDNLRAFYEEHYPGVELLEIHAESPADLIRQLQELQHA